MIVVTGAAGFIASCLVSRLNAANFNDVVAVDNFSIEKKLPNIEGKKLREYVDRETFFDWLDANHEQVEFIFHLGARTDTAEMDPAVLRGRPDPPRAWRVSFACSLTPTKYLSCFTKHWPTSVD